MDTVENQALFAAEMALSPPAGLAVQRREAAARGELVLSFPLGPPGADVALTTAEREVARELVLGRSNREIADRRRVSVRTVANQVGGLFRKLGVHSRLELALSLPSHALDPTSRRAGHRVKPSVPCLPCPALRTL